MTKQVIGKQLTSKQPLSTKLKAKFEQLKTLVAEHKQRLKVVFNAELQAVKRLEKDDLDLANSGQWPASVKALSLVVIVIGLMIFSHWLLINSYKDELESLNNQQEKLIEGYRLASFQAANLGAYKQQMLIIEETFADLLEFLPLANEVPQLLDAIQQEADQKRLELVSLKMGTLKPQNFYTEIPFTIQVQGKFHHLAGFIAGISSLDRIVTLHDFELKPAEKNRDQLLLTLEAQTYRYDQAKQTRGAN